YEINLGGGAGIVVPVDPNAEPPPAPSASGLAVHLAFDEAAGSLTALNTGTAGAAQNGAVTGATFVAGKLGNAVQIDGQDHIVAGPTPVTGAAARTTSVWVKMSGASTAIRTALTFGQNSSGGKWDVDIDTAGNFELGIANGRTDSAGSPNVADGAWHNLTAVLPSGATTLAGAKFYVDGAPIAFTATSAQVINTAAGGSLIVGHAANSGTFQQFAGDIDDLAIWTRPLGATEVAAMVSLANTAGYDAGNVDTLLAAFASASNVTIDGVTWTYRASGLTGPAGVVQTTATNRYEINLGGGAGFVVAADPDPQPATDGLTVHLAFDESPGSATAINGGLSAAANDGAITGATYVAGKLGNAVQIDALDRIVAGPTPISGAAARTTSVWVKLPGASTAIRTALTFGTNSNGSKWDLDVDAAGNFELGIANGRTDSAGSPNVADGAWHNLTAVLPSGATTLAGLKFYVDGAPISFTATSTQLIKTASTGSLIIGHAANSLNFQQYAGEIDDVAIWARPLSATEVRAMVSLANTAGLHYNAGDLDAMLAAFRAGTDIVIDGTTWKYRASGLTGAGVVGVGTGGNLYELDLGGGAGFVVPLGTSTSDALTVHMPFDDAAGSPIALNTGTSGAANNGSVSGTEFVGGKLGNAVQFAGLDRITAGFAPIVGSAARTTSVWVKVPGPSTSIRTAFSFGTNSNGGKWDVDIDAAGNFEIGIAGGRIDSAGSSSVTDGAWHNLTAVLPSGANKLGQLQLYVDGAPITFTATATTAINTAATGAFIVGQSVNSTNFQQLDGQLDDLAIWNRPLAAIEVRAFVSLANTLQYDAGKAEALLSAFGHGSGVVLDGRAWVYRASGLTGPEGAVAVATDGFTYALNLGGGAGLAAVN
ncbi:MAG: hypothetical protein HOV81_06840, partial [Kofleriaceae bacterium]|nr:hypothetical protein [Kofleriaceae bacterium]